MTSPKPWYLDLITRPYQWVAWNGTVYHPAGLNPDHFPALVAHESTHLKQQTNVGKWRWLWSYLTDAHFRLCQEAEGIAVEAFRTPTILRESLITRYAAQLSGNDYRVFGKPASPDYETARYAILIAMEAIQ